MTSDRFKILLIAPTALDSAGRPIRQRRLHLPCLTLPLLAAATPENVDVRLIYETVEDIPWEDHWDLVGLTGMGSGIVRAWQIADEFRRRGTKVVLGGIAAGISDPSWSLEHCDSVVLGEADEIWRTVVADAMAGRLQTVYKPASSPDLKKLPEPRYDLMNRRRVGIWRPVQATRGCPYRCSFCSVTAFFNNEFRTRPIDDVVRDVEAAKRHGSRYIAFVDDNMIGDPDYCAKLWEALIPHRIIWMTQCDIQLAESEELLKLAYRSGCRLVSIGIESTSAESLHTIGKSWNRPERYTDAITAFRRYGIEVSTEMILGFDTDDHTVFNDTLKFVMNSRIAVPRVHILTPIPGTPLFRELESAGRILQRDFGNYTGSKVVFRPAQIAPEDLQRNYWGLYEKLFSWRSILRRLIPAATSPGPYMRAVIWAANYRYRKHVKARISPGIL
jgi:radical SAM superfamily enzyme YgiQ (UPF0313 family)